MMSQENEYFLKHIKGAIATLRHGRQRPDNKIIASAATNLAQGYIDQILQEVLRFNLIYNRPAERDLHITLRTKAVI